MSNIKQIVLACHLYSQDYREQFPFAVGALYSNDHLYLLMPNYMTTARPFICPDEVQWKTKTRTGPCRSSAKSLTKEDFNIPNVNSYAFIGGMNQAAPSDSPLAGDNIMDVRRANVLGTQQFQKRTSCSTKGSNHGKDGSNTAFVDGHGEFNTGRKLRIRWQDANGGTDTIKNPNGL